MDFTVLLMNYKYQKQEPGVMKFGWDAMNLGLLCDADTYDVKVQHTAPGIQKLIK